MSAHQPIRRLLVAYDIADDVRRARIADALSAFGERVQYSVFVVDGRTAQFVRLRARLRTMIDADRDALLFCDLGPTDALGADGFEQIGNSRPLWSDLPPIA